MRGDHEADGRVAKLAAAIGEPARARILYCLMGNRARTSTELALVAGVSPSTASVHLHRLMAEGLIKVLAQGKHRYYSIEGADVAALLESLAVFSGGVRDEFVPTTPTHLRAARTCYDHIAGTLGVALHDRVIALGWVAGRTVEDGEALDVTPAGGAALAKLGIDLDAMRRLRRRLAFPCLDWSERRPHLGGALGAALLSLSLGRRWVVQDRDSRSLRVTPAGQRAFCMHFGLRDA
ncbi:MAG TPA: helix-turn-helix transcriptional regulator [Gemmatimonadaceae bacterium]|nr:helix-turn-helix transcriptional regulator [Gemmatimonadaceae bacterium]